MVVLFHLPGYDMPAHYSPIYKEVPSHLITVLSIPIARFIHVSFNLEENNVW